ncbi:MAG TPA: hypothetical protein VKQ36_09400 [Ktedonobacterales bacterium]|nr:hypothetical protein [Ktedonobacterales bacterium]
MLSVNGLRIRPMMNKQVVMDPDEAARLCTILKPRYAVPMHYAFTGGALQDPLLLKHDGTLEQFATAAARYAPETTVRILPTGEPLRV